MELILSGGYVELGIKEKGNVMCEGSMIRYKTRKEKALENEKTYQTWQKNSEKKSTFR